MGPRDPGRERLPLPALALAVVAIAFFALPFVGLLWRAPWSEVRTLLTEKSVRQALHLSVVCSLWSTGLSMLFGVPLAWLLARGTFPGKSAVRALCTLSMVLPPVVGGVALFFALGRHGLLGQYLDRWFGITLPFTTPAVVIAQTFVAMPFLVITVEASLRQLDRRYEEAARTLGGSRWYVFRRVTLPTIRPALIAGGVLAWARALGEFGATITFAGSFPGTTQTMPLAVSSALETDPRQAIVLSLVLIVVSFAVLVALRDRWLGGVGPQPGGVVSLEASIQVSLGSLDLAVDLSVADGEVVAILGPNGSGKTTLLRCLAGLHPIDAGCITIDGTTLDDPGGAWVPPEARPIGVVFQDYLLFAHLSALENVAFGLRARGATRAAARLQAAGWLERVGLSDHADHRPGALSGGQAQRVALARALATDPRLLLLDEPLAALDAGARDDVRRDLRRHLTSFGGMRVLVTHDPVDAYALAERVIVLEHGRVVQSGSLADVTAHPRSRYVADLVGVNLITGQLAARALTTATGAVIIAADDTPDGAAFAAIHPRAVALHARAPEGSPRNAWASTVVDIDLHADRARVRLDGPVALTAEITPAALTELDLHAGDAVWAAVKATEVTTYPA